MAAILAAGIVLQLIPHPSNSFVHRGDTLDNYFPRTVFGWKSTDHPLGDTESLSAVVKDTLNYDEAILRTFQKDGREFTVYVAFWKAGKMSSREVAYHTPDICWPSAGWNCTTADYDFRRLLFGKELAPAQYREFEQNGQRQNVLFWHIYNGRTITYVASGAPSRLSMLTDLFRRGVRQKGEQYFIRISSPTSFTPLWNDEGFQEILELIAPLGPGLNSSLESFENNGLK